jgi:nucleoside-diphosphate-sugar epimerase/2-polyprenyl-3-methyl-5-hydroxy-6-metoxy-1,4-benzoquinol methylase
MQILITGGTGFIGSRLALQCLQRKDEVIILGQENTRAERENLQMLKDSGAKVVLGSITDKGLLNEVTIGTDVVFHLAAAQHEANIPDQIFYDINVEGTRNLIEASIKAKVKRFIHGSTIGVYGSPNGPVNEMSTCNPVNIYGKTKLEGEKVVLSYKNEIPLVNIRISETYGPGDRRLLKLFKAIKKKVYFRIGPGKNLHQLIYIDDLINGMLMASESKKALGESILLVGSKAVTTDEMCDTIAQVLNTSIPGFRAPLMPFKASAAVLETVLKPFGIQPPLHRRRMDFFTKSFSFSETKAEDLLDFVPKHSFKDGIEMTADWYFKNGMLSDNGENEEHKIPEKLIVDRNLTAQIEPFDTFWEAPKDIEKGYSKFNTFYKCNYLRHMPVNRKARILVISCGTGYMVASLNKAGYKNVLGIDSDQEKVQYAIKKNLNCIHDNAFSYLEQTEEKYDLIFAEQEINHLTKKEIKQFLALCYNQIEPGGALCVHSLNGANPITGAEALSQNYDHYNTFTSYSLEQILRNAGFVNVKVFPLKLYVFYKNPLNYVGIVLTFLLETFFRIGFIFYGKDNKIFSKKIGAICFKEMVIVDKNGA